MPFAGSLLRLSQCGLDLDEDAEGYLQLTDSIVDKLEDAAKRSVEDPHLMTAAALLGRLERRQLYQFVGSVVIKTC